MGYLTQSLQITSISKIKIKFKSVSVIFATKRCAFHHQIRRHQHKVVQNCKFPISIITISFFFEKKRTTILMRKGYIDNNQSMNYIRRHEASHILAYLASIKSFLLNCACNVPFCQCLSKLVMSPIPGQW